MTKDNKKNEDPFLKDLIGVKPLKKKHTLNKIIPKTGTKKIINKIEIKQKNEKLKLIKKLIFMDLPQKRQNKFF